MSYIHVEAITARRLCLVFGAMEIEIHNVQSQSCKLHFRLTDLTALTLFQRQFSRSLLLARFSPDFCSTLRWLSGFIPQDPFQQVRQCCLKSWRKKAKVPNALADLPAPRNELKNEIFATLSVLIILRIVLSLRWQN